jgi:hypothetical protein
MPDCFAAKWAAWRLAVSSMHNYAATSAGAWPMPRPTGGCWQTLPRRGAARLARSRSSMPCLRPWRRGENAQRRAVAEIKVGYRTATVAMPSSPKEGPGRQGDGGVGPVCGREQSGGRDHGCQSAMQTCLCAVAGSSSSVSMQAARSVREMLKQRGRLRSVAVR